MSKSITKTELENGFRSLGVKVGMIIEVHCSLSSFGYVDGGAEAIIEILKRIVGVDGAIVMPSFRLSPDLTLTDIDSNLRIIKKIKILHDDDEKSAMGIVSDTFRKMPDVVTGQGIFRVSAWGKDAEKHSLGFQHLIDSNGYALLLGVDIYSLSAMHYVEDDLPEKIRDMFRPSAEARKNYPESEWFIESWKPIVKPWHTIQERAYQQGFIVDAIIGNSKCMLLKVKDVIEIYRHALQTEPFELYGLT